MTSWTLRRTAGATALLLAAGGTVVTTVGVPALASAGSHHAARAGSGFTFVTAAGDLSGKHGIQVGIFHGSISGGGKDTPLSNSDVIKLPGGSVTVKHPGSQSTFTPKVDKSTCYVSFVTKGPFTLTSGTGKYAGISGSGTFVGHGYGYAPRTSDGSCNLNKEPISEVFVVKASGTRSS
jgi:hypothetical protein